MKRLTQGTAVAVIMGSAACPIFAQEADPANVGVAELQARVEALEAQAADDTSNLSFNLNDTTKITLYGFVRAEAFYDFDTVQGDLTRTNRIGEEEFDTNGEFDTSVRVSRFGILSTTASAIGDIDTQLEFDLFGSGGDESSSPNLRLRHANINIDDTYRVGQFWSNFMPLVHYPRTADFNGPVGITFARVPQARYTYKTDTLELSASLEESNGGPSSDPVATAAAFYKADNYSLRVAGLVGTFEDDDGDDVNTRGVTVSGAFSPFEGATFTGTFTAGQGLGNLLIGGGDQAFEGSANDSTSFTLEYKQDINEQLSVGIAYGQENYDDPTNTGTIDFDELRSVFINAFYTPVERLTIAGEYSRGSREGSSGTDTADRISLTATYSF